ncbi:MAG TPA: cation diffusion facilitator family transporter [Chitinophagaceae bacterium]|nr:cation diffusion facilitator family transporter [Chitinophagaceae bacterium]HNU14896.1 cation diffusion facilitator family transporter [Chitinophagaceae bacterium]
MDLRKEQQNLRVQKWVATLSVIILAIKFIAYYTTHSVAILTDALESIVNVAAGFIGLYSLYVAAKPRDFDHPYGHGKAEFISSAIEGTLISSAGAIILYKAVQNLINPVQLYKLDLGIWLVAVTAAANYIIGYFCLATGKKNNSLALIASGKHLQSDSLSTVGIVTGLLLLFFTGLRWIDSVVAMLFGTIIIVTGYRILRQSVAGIMDEADIGILGKMVEILNANRQEDWVDMHNLRVIKYGTVLHVDCHLTVPWYYNVHEAHEEIDFLASLIRKEFGESLELFVHSDGCLPFSCQICKKSNCRERKNNFEKEIKWTLENISKNKKHELV